MATCLKADWPAPKGIIAGMTYRFGGISEGAYRSLNLAAHVGDDAGAVRENRRRFLVSCGLPEEPGWLDQEHGKHVITVPPRKPAAADGMTTRLSGVVCAVLTADCLPVLFTSVDGSVVAAAHAGWRGLAAGVLEATVNAMAEPPQHLLAWLGPAISQPAFEVGQEVRQQFCDRDPAAAVHFARNARGRWQADLYGLARQRLHAAGLRQVHGGTHCTHADEQRFFSYRRDGQCGRMCSFVFRNSA